MSCFVAEVSVSTFYAYACMKYSHTFCCLFDCQYYDITGFLYKLNSWSCHSRLLEVFPEVLLRSNHLPMTRQTVIAIKLLFQDCGLQNLGHVFLTVNWRYSQLRNGRREGNKGWWTIYCLPDSDRTLSGLVFPSLGGVQLALLRSAFLSGHIFLSCIWRPGPAILHTSFMPFYSRLTFSLACCWIKKWIYE